MIDAETSSELKRLHRVLDAVSPPICYFDSEMKYVYFNDAYQRRISRSLDEVRGRHVSVVLGEVIYEFIRPHLEVALRGERVTFEQHVPGVNGTFRYTRIEFIPDLNHQGQLQGLIGIITDLHDHKELENALREAVEHMEAQALQDSLTGLGNHRAFLERLDEAERAFGRDASPCALLFFDVDSFKSFNDTFGHPAGDLVLKQVARLFNTELRPGDLAARYGGEEFAVLLRGASELEAIHCAERLRSSVQNAMWPLRSVTVSGGIACFSKHTPRGTSVLQLADKGLYLAKQSGKNRVCLVPNEAAMRAAQSAIPGTLDCTSCSAFA